MKLIDFYADWCQPCQAQMPIVEQLEEELDIPVEKVDVDEEQQKANKYSVRSLPTIVIVDDEGNPLKQFQGLTQREEIKEAIESLK